MDADKLNAVRQLQQSFPALTVSEARALLEAHRWNVGGAAAEAEAQEAARTRREAAGAAEYFVGGAGQGGSAQQVLAQPPEQDVHKMVEELFAKAGRQEAGAEGSAAEDATGGGPQAFFGRGRRLGYTTNPSPFMAATLRQTRSVNIATYRNGFRVDDGPLIPLQSAEGREFAAALAQGYIPASLAAAHPDTDFTATLQDFLDRDYDPQTSGSGAGAGEAAAPSHNFQGAGHRLVEPQGETRSTATASFDAQRSFACDEGGEDVTTVCLLTTAGKKAEVRLNANRHTVEDLYLLAHRVEPALGSFVLVVRDRPPRRLEGDEVRRRTIADAKLKRAVVVIQKL